MSADRLRMLVFGLLVVAGVLALVGTVTESAIAGWLGVAALATVLVVYVQWRRVVRRRRY